MREISLDRLRTLVAIADLGWCHAKIRPIRYHKPASYVEVCIHASWL